MSRSKAKGTAWETMVCDYLRGLGWLHVERRALSGTSDRGDVAGIPGLVVECKNEKALSLAGWVDEAEVERANDRARYGVVWHHRRGRGSPADAYVTMTGAQFVSLLRDAGYAPSQVTQSEKIQELPGQVAASPFTGVAL